MDAKVKKKKMKQNNGSNNYRVLFRSPDLSQCGVILKQISPKTKFSLEKDSFILVLQ